MCGGEGSVDSRTAVSNRTFWDDGNVYNLCCEIWCLLDICGYWALEKWWVWLRNFESFELLINLNWYNRMWLAAAISVQHKMHISLGSSPRFTIDPSYLTSLSLCLFLYKMRIATIPTILYGLNEIREKAWSTILCIQQTLRKISVYYSY